MIEAIYFGIKSCLYAVGFGISALIVTSFLKECSNIWKNTLFLLGGKVMIEAIYFGIKSCLYAVGFGISALIVTSFLKECSNIWKNK